MAWMRSADPVRDWEAREADNARRLTFLPKCEECEEPIDQDTAVCINGCWYCDECLKGFRRYTA